MSVKLQVATKKTTLTLPFPTVTAKNTKRPFLELVFGIPIAGYCRNMADFMKRRPTHSVEMKGSFQGNENTATINITSHLHVGRIPIKEL